MGKIILKNILNKYDNVKDGIQPIQEMTPRRVILTVLANF